MADWSKLEEQEEYEPPSEGADGEKKFRLQLNIHRHTRRRLKAFCDDVADDQGRVSLPVANVVRALIMELLAADPDDEWVKKVIARSLRDSKKIESD